MALRIAFPPPLGLRSSRSPIIPCLATAAGAIEWSGNGDVQGNALNSMESVDQLEQLMRGPSAEYNAPTPLPSTPQTATLGALMPYLARLALGEGQLYWRVAGALIALIMSVYLQ